MINMPKSSLQCYSVLSDILVKKSNAYHWKGGQMFYLLVKVAFAYLLLVSLKSLPVSVLSTKRRIVQCYIVLSDFHPTTNDNYVT